VANTAPVAYLLAAGLIAFGGCTVWLQVRGMRVLRARTHVPSDELGYLRGRHRRRLITGSLLALIGGMIAGAYLSGLEPQIDAIKPPPADPDRPAGKGDPPEMTPEQKRLVKTWVAYWVGVLVLVFAVLGFAFADTMATRRYALQQYRILKEDHEAKLRRDLAVYKAQKDASRGGRGRGGGGSPAGEDEFAG
jgi:hypothetical protein